MILIFEHIQGNTAIRLRDIKEVTVKSCRDTVPGDFEVSFNSGEYRYRVWTALEAQNIYEQVIAEMRRHSGK